VTIYQARPLYSVKGLVKDSNNGSAIPTIEVSANSSHYPSIPLFFETSGSDGNGFYRLWGRETVSIEVDDGRYYPYKRTMELSQDDVADIILERMPERSCYVNGSLVDTEGTPLSGSVLIVDPAHNGYGIGRENVNETGTFSIRTYPGSLKAVFGNASIWDNMNIDVPSDGISGLILVLAQTTFINGTVTDPIGDPVEGIELMLSGGSGTAVFDNVTTTTNASGGFSFEVGRGEYRIDFAGSGEYGPVNVTGIECDGWTPQTVDIVLENLTEGYVYGRVIGSGGPYDGIGIPSAMVFIWPSQDLYSFENLTADEDGLFSFVAPFEIGTAYILGANPPTLLSGKEGVRSGYLWNDTGNMTLDRYRTEFNIEIPYHLVPDMVWANVTEYGPVGTGVLLNEPIRINFTHIMKFDINDVTIEPSVVLSGLELIGTGVVIKHANFQPDTIYTFTFPGNVYSTEGHPLWNHTGITWSFTTGSTYWELYSANVYSVDALELHVEARGQRNLTVFIVIEGVGSFQLEEGEPGGYSTLVNESYFGWNRYYNYHFSDRAGGEDLSPLLSGGFRTPFGGKPPQPPDGEIDNEMTPLGCLTCCGIGSAVIAAIVGVVLLLSRIKSRHDEREE
jgi:hypothetical protein